MLRQQTQSGRGTARRVIPRSSHSSRTHQSPPADGQTAAGRPDRAPRAPPQTRAPPGVRIRRGASVTCPACADLAPARCRPLRSAAGRTSPLARSSLPTDAGVIGVVTSCQYRCARCGSWPPALRFSPSPTLLPPSLSLPWRLSVAGRRLPDPSPTLS